MKNKGSQESVVKEAEENLLAKNWMNLFLRDFVKGVVKAFECHKNLL